MTPRGPAEKPSIDGLAAASETMPDQQLAHHEHEQERPQVDPASIDLQRFTA